MLLDPDPDSHSHSHSESLFERQKPGLFVNFGQFPCSWIRIRIRIPIRIRTWIQDSKINADLCGRDRQFCGAMDKKYIFKFFQLLYCFHVINAVIVMFPCSGVAQNGQADWKPLVPQGMGIPPQYFTVFAFAMWPHGTKQ
jgi:hypothetical protein